VGYKKGRKFNSAPPDPPTLRHARCIALRLLTWSCFDTLAWFWMRNSTTRSWPPSAASIRRHVGGLLLHHSRGCQVGYVDLTGLS
jgi:hypothetical protein